MWFYEYKYSTKLEGSTCGVYTFHALYCRE